jgi:hypothetical protein
LGKLGKFSEKSGEKWEKVGKSRKSWENLGKLGKVGKSWENGKKVKNFRKKVVSHHMMPICKIGKIICKICKIFNLNVNLYVQICTAQFADVS